MQLEVGKIYEGKVTGITKFGAFVELDKDTTGMVHISEVANTFVSEIKDFLKEGQDVKVKVLAVNDDGKISLSIKKALPAPPRKPRPEGTGFRPNNNNNNGNRPSGNGGRPVGNGNRPSGNSGGFNRNRNFSNQQPQDLKKNPPPTFNGAKQQPGGDSDFEDMLNKFKATSEEKFSDLKHVIENKRKSPSRRK